MTHVPGIYRHFVSFLFKKIFFSTQFPRDTPAAAAKSLQSCLTLCDPIDSSPPGSPVPGILQARTLEWVAISSSNAWKWKVKVKSLSYVWLFATPWTAASQAPQSMGFSRQEYWSGVLFPSPTDIEESFLFINFLLPTCALGLLVACTGISTYYAEQWKDLVQIQALPPAGFIT